MYCSHIHGNSERLTRGCIGWYIEAMSHDETQIQRMGETTLSGVLRLYVAFDWGEEIDLEKARRLASGAVLDLSRRPRTPISIGYKPPPLRFPLPAVTMELPGLGPMETRSAVATVFDFAAVSISFSWPLSISVRQLRLLAGGLPDPATAAGILGAARAAVEPLHRALLRAIRNPVWQQSLWEEYYVFQFPPGPPLQPDALLDSLADWVAGLLRLEDEPLSEEEVAEALRLALRYGRHDLFIPDWAAAVLVENEQECEETLQAVEFANLQLLEYRHIDNRLDDIVAQAYRLLERASRARLPFWRTYDRPLRVLGQLKVDANALFERTTNVLKLIGDQYLARVYRLVATRFHLREWQRNIERKLEGLEGVYEVISHQSATFRTEFLEIIVIVLILIELVLAVVRH
jgi:hypothetical protein